MVGPTYPFRGGIAHYTTLMCRHLQRRHDVRVISFNRLYPSLIFPGRTQMDESSRPLTIEAEPLIDSLNPWTWWRAYRAVKAFNPHVLVFQWWNPFFGPPYALIGHLSRRLKGMACTFICHNVIPHEHGPLDKILSRAALGAGTHFIVHSHQDQELLLGLFPRAAVRVTPHPTYSVFGQNRVQKEEARKTLGISGPTILFFGYIRAYKGLKYLLEAAPHVLREMQCTFLIVGEFYEDKETYLRQIQNLGIGSFVRVVDRYVPNEEVNLYFSAADVVVLPYVSASQSGIVQMAFGMERPVITTRVGGIPEVVSHGGTGYIVPPGDGPALARAVLRFFREGQSVDWAGNIRKEQERFSWDALAAVLEELIEEFTTEDAEQTKKT
ncbi:MAG: glycosyltransferase [Deltaproteobacteria bacterium]|nr:glycosyltransferase [Deltaproteobacteria bacterium]